MSDDHTEGRSWGPPDVDGPSVPSITTGPIEAAPAVRSVWVGRVLAVAAAVALVGGGGYLAVRAGTAQGGADSPEAALRGALDALANEDLLGAGEFVEPTERRLLVDAGVDIAEELVRLEVLADDLDLSSIAGVDLEFSGLELTSVSIEPDLAHVYIDGGRVTGSVDVAELPLGALVLDRAPADWLEFRETDSEAIEPVDNPIVVVERDGRWYLSLWYSVAENLRLEADLAPPDRSRRPVPIGGATPEAAVESMVAAAVDVDLAALIGAIDPEEAAALYDYAPLFLDDAQRTVDEWLSDVRRDGWQWAVTDLGLSSTSEGERGEVVVENFTFEARGDGTSIDVRVDGRSLRLSVVDDYSTTEVVSDGECTTFTYDDGGIPDTEEICVGEIGGLGALTGGAIANLQGVPQAGIVTHRVDGRWYVSPTRTGSNAVLSALAAFEPEDLAATVDAFVDFAEDPFGLTEATELGGFATPIDPETSAIPLELVPGSSGTFDNTRHGRPLLYEFELGSEAIGSELAFWVPDIDPSPFDRGVYAEVQLSDIGISTPNAAVVMTAEFTEPGVELPPIDTIVPGELLESGFAYVRTEIPGRPPVLGARTDQGIVLVATYMGWSDELLEVLRDEVEAG